MMDVRRSALERIGGLRKRRGIPDSTSYERLQIYYERQIGKNPSGRLSDRRISAFIGLCGKCISTDTSCSVAYILENLQELLNRCSNSTRLNAAEELSNKRLFLACQMAFSAILCLDRGSNYVPEEVLAYVDQLVESAKAYQQGKSCFSLADGILTSR